MRVEAIGAGVLVELIAVAVGATLPLPPELRINAGVALLTIGLAGGYVAGRVAGGNWRKGILHGSFAGAIGGVVLAVVLGYTMVTPGSEVGALWGLNYLIATGGLPTEFAAVYDRQLAIVFPALIGVLLAIEGAVAGGAAGTVSVEPP
ncbi:hypothetical protein [Haladaptatus caseinilyticus]|uniref:hypothetical protein n=1 Tax=Haladaptatus caseinilyticus TaxID=2993314 RepID=UPI00224AAB09|nr:hypothetical protein [Haladaptatus caseinilyticus]